MIKDLTRMLAKCRNPAVKRTIEADLKSYKTIKRLLDDK